MSCERHVSSDTSTSSREVRTYFMNGFLFKYLSLLINKFSDIVQFVPSMLMPSLPINQVISIPPDELTLTTTDGINVKIPIPNSHIGKKPIHVRLLSSKRRIGMVYYHINLIN